MAKGKAVKKKQPSGKKKKTPAPQQSSQAMSTDYANIFRFLFAGSTDAGFRSEVGSGEENRIRAALLSIGIDLPHAAFEGVVTTCVQIAEMGGEDGNGWTAFDNLRAHLLGNIGTGAA